MVIGKAPTARDLPTLESLLGAIHSAQADLQAARARSGTFCPPRSTGCAIAYGPWHAKPPPHIRVHARQQLTAYELEEQRAAQQRASTRGHREPSGLPWWAFVVAARCHAGGHMREVAQLPAYLAGPVRTAVQWARSEHAARSIAAVGCVLAWCSLRHPKRCGRPSNVGGLHVGLLRTLTRRKDGARYSVSSVQHRSHTTGAAGDASAGEAGFVEALVQAGALRRWVPAARDVPDWMRGKLGYAFCVFRAPTDDAARAPPVDDPLASLLALF